MRLLTCIVVFLFVPALVSAQEGDKAYTEAKSKADAAIAKANDEKTALEYREGEGDLKVTVNNMDYGLDDVKDAIDVLYNSVSGQLTEGQLTEVNKRKAFGNAQRGLWMSWKVDAATARTAASTALTNAANANNLKDKLKYLATSLQEAEKAAYLYRQSRGFYGDGELSYSIAAAYLNELICE